MTADVLTWTNYVVLGYFVALHGGYLAVMLVAARRLVRYNRRLKAFRPAEMLMSEVLPPITLIAPAYNEAPTCVASARALLSLDYPRFDVIVVNDGSSDATLQRLQDAFQLEPSGRPPTADLETAPVRTVYRSRIHPNLWVIDKENGGKADALNTGIKYCTTPLFCAMDADTLIEADGLIRLTRPFLEDDATVAAGGTIRIANGCTVESGRVQSVRLPSNLLAKLQSVEYLRAFLLGRVGWDAIGTTLIISGAFGLFRRSAVVDAGGYQTDTVGEDMELVVRMHRHLREEDTSYRVRFVPDAVAWTECPERASALGAQRDRWQRGLADTLIRHQTMLANPSYGKVGLLAYPFFYILEMLGPLFELVGYLLFGVSLALGSVSLPFAIAFLSVTLGLGLVLSFVTVALEEYAFNRYEASADLLQLLGLPVLEAFGYRQLIAWYRLRGLWSYIRDVDAWGAMERKGFQPDAATTDAAEA